MKITMKTAVALFNGMSAIDSNEKTDLDDKVRVRLAININLLRPFVEVYEKQRNQMVIRIGAGAKFDPVVNTNIEIAASEMLDEEIEPDLALKKFAQADFKLKENKRITGSTIAMIASLIKDFGAGETDD